jgi:hypothetical protein
MVELENCSYSCGKHSYGGPNRVSVVYNAARKIRNMHIAYLFDL